MFQPPDDAAGLASLAGVRPHTEGEFRRQVVVRAQPRATVRQIDDGAAAQAGQVVVDVRGAIKAGPRRFSPLRKHGAITATVRRDKRTGTGRLRP